MITDTKIGYMGGEREEKKKINVRYLWARETPVNTDESSLENHSVRRIPDTGHGCRKETRPVGQEGIILPLSVGLPEDGPSHQRFTVTASCF